MVLRFNLTSRKQDDALRTAIQLQLADLWDFSEGHADVCVSRRKMKSLKDVLPKFMWEDYAVLIPDVARAAAASYSSRPATMIAKGGEDDSSVERNANEIASATSSAPVHGEPNYNASDIASLFFQEYQPLSAIESWMDLLNNMIGTRDIVTKFSIGQSAEGRDISALRIGNRSLEPSKEKPRKTILITGGLHGREWISPATVNYLAWSFATAYRHESVVTGILDTFDLVVVPILNVDGYEYTWQVDRLWRKSRQPTFSPLCKGYDLDHAFGYQWDAAGREEEPCAPAFGGTEPFQAVEAAALAHWAKVQVEENVEFTAYLDFHSYSQQILWPYINACEHSPPGLENMMEVAMNMAKIMRLSRGGEVYRVGSACRHTAVAAWGNEPSERPASRRLLEPVGGSAIDYFHHEIGPRYSYQIQLRDVGMHAYLLPSDQIVPTGREFFSSIKFLGDYLLGNNGIEDIAEEYVEKKADGALLSVDVAISS
jgi:extracellular matrix protein 14